MDKEKFRRKVEGFLWGLFGRRVMYASDPAAWNVTVTMGMKDVSKQCTTCCVPRKEWRAGNGWVDLFDYDDDGKLYRQPDGTIPITRHYGVVMWYWKKGSDGLHS